MEFVELKPFGVEIVDVDLAGSLIDADVAQIGALFDEHFLLVARGQHLSEDDQVRIIGLLFPGGPIADQLGDGSAFSYVSNTRPDGIFGDGALTFHSDFAFTTSPDALISLYGADVDAGAADTDFASAARALDELSDDVLERLQYLNVINATDLKSTEARLPEYNLPGRQDLSGIPHDECVRARWPAITKHLRTGRPLLMVNEQHAHHFEGVPLDESRELLEQIYAALYDDHNVYGHRWAEGDLVAWDNLAVHHGRRATPPSRATRTLRRVRIGEVSITNMVDFSQAGVV